MDMTETWHRDYLEAFQCKDSTSGAEHEKFRVIFQLLALIGNHFNILLFSRPGH
jgi:hypothetical protein